MRTHPEYRSSVDASAILLDVAIFFNCVQLGFISCLQTMEQLPRDSFLSVISVLVLHIHMYISYFGGRYFHYLFISTDVSGRGAAPPPHKPTN
jgi:hypothetical protein